MSMKDYYKKQLNKGMVEKRAKRVDKSNKENGRTRTKNQNKYINNGDLISRASGTVYAVRKSGGDFSYYDDVRNAGARSVANYKAQKEGKNPYEVKYIRTHKPQTINTKDGKSFKSDYRMLTKKEQNNYKKYGTLTKPDSELEKKVKKVASGVGKAVLGGLDIMGTPGYLITGATKGVVDGFNGNGKLDKGELKNAIKGASKNIKTSWDNKGKFNGEGKFGFGDVFDSVDALEERKKKNDPNYESKQIYRASTGNGFDRDKLSDKTKKTLNTIGGMGLDMALPMELNLPLGTFLRGTGKSFTNVAKNFDAKDIGRVVDTILDGQKVDDIAKEVMTHKAMNKVNKLAGNIDKNSMEGVKLLGKELLSGEQVAKIGDATGISRAYNQVRHFMQQGQRSKNVEDVVANVVNKQTNGRYKLVDPLVKTSMKMDKEQYDLAMGFRPDWKLRKEAKDLDNRFIDKVGKNVPSEKPNWMLSEDEINDIQIGKPNVELDGKSIDEFIKRTNGIERYTDTFDATNVSEITPLTTHSDINKTPGRFKIASKPKSNEKKIIEIEKDLGISIDEFITHMDKDAQDYALSKFPQYKADFLLDEIDKRNPKVNEIFDDFGSESFDMNVENTVPSIKNTPNVNSAEKEKEKQAIDALMKIFEKKYNTGHTANYVLPHKQRQDMYVNKMSDLFTSKTPIDENVEKQITNMVDYINYLGKKKLTEQDKDKIAKTLNVVLFENKPVIRNNMGDGDFKEFINFINDGISDQKSGVPDILNRGLKDFKRYVNGVTDPNSDLKRKYLARKYGYETKSELEREIKELQKLAKKDPSKFGEFKKKEQILQARNDEHIKIRDLGENEWNDYYSKWRNKGKNNLDGYYETIEEVSEQMRKEMDAKLERAEEIKNSNIGKALEVKEVKGKQYYDNLKNTRKELGLKYTEFRKDKITPIPQKAHDNLPMVNISVGNKTKQVKDYNRLESVRSSKLNLKKLIEVREQMRFATTKDARNLQNIPSYDPRIINDMIKQELNYLDAIGVPRDTYVESMQMYVASYKKSLEQQFGHLPTNDPLTKTKNKFKSKKENDYYLEKIKKKDDISDVLDSDIEVPLKMNLQMCARQFVGEEVEELPGISNKVLQANNDNLVSMFDKIRQVLPNRKGFEEETANKINHSLEDIIGDAEFDDVPSLVHSEDSQVGGYDRNAIFGEIKNRNTSDIINKNEKRDFDFSPIRNVIKINSDNSVSRVKSPFEQKYRIDSNNLPPTSGIYNGHQIINKNTGNVTDWIPFNATDEQIEKMQRSINFSNSDIKKSDVIKEFNSNPGAFFNDFHKMNGLLSNLNIKRDIGAPIEDKHLDKLMWYVNKYTEDTSVPTGSILRNPGTMTNRGATDDQHLEALRMNEIFDRIKSNENSGLAEDIADETQRRKEQMSIYEDLFGQGGTLDNVRRRSLEGMFEEGEMKLRKEAQLDKETKGYDNFVKTQKAMNKSMKEAEFKAKTRSTLDDNHLEALRMNEIFDRVQKNFDSGLAEDIANERERRSTMLSTYEDLFAPGGTLDNVRRRSLERMLEDGDIKLRREAKAKKEAQGFENFVKTQKAMNESMKKAELKANTRHTKLDKEQKELDAKVLKERIELGKKLDEQYAQNDAIKQAINEQRVAKGEAPIELDENDPQVVKSYYDFEESDLKKATDKILKPYDGLLKDFKANVTVNNFGWHAGNFMQNKLLNAQDIGSRAFFPRTDAKDVLKGREGVYNNGNGTEMDYNLMRRYLEEGGIMNNFINKEVQSSNEGNPLSKLFHNVFRASGKNSIGSGFGLLQKNQDETLAKIQNVMAHMDDGDDILTAMDKAQRTLFDYDDLSDKEKNIAKRIIPFYAYAKKNTANQLDYLMNDQRTHTKLLNAYRNIQEQIPYGEEREIKPGEENYLKGRIQIPGMTKEHKGKEFNYMLNPKLPFNPTDSADGMTNFSPFINPLIDIAKNENFFGEEIEEPVKYYLDELKDSYTHPIIKTKENIERHKEKGQDFRIPPEIMKILLGISGNYY